MIHLALIFLIVIAIVGMVATVIRVAIDYRNGDVVHNPPIKTVIFVMIMSPLIGWIFIADWILKFSTKLTELL